MIEEAIILSGGVGSRMQGATMSKYPKGLAMVNDKPLLYWCIKWLGDNGVSKVILALGHLAENIIEYFGEHIEIGGKKIEILYSIEKEKLGSGGAVKLASQYITGDNCFIMNGDLLTDIPGDKMISQHLEEDVDGTMLLVKLRSRFGVVEVDNKLISKFVEKPMLPVFIHAGIDIVKSEILKEFPDKGQMEDTIFVEMANRGSFGAVHAEDGYFWEAVDTPKELKEANKNWKY